MINLSDALRSAPQLFVAGLPASEAVDHILTCFDEAVLFHTAVHMGSPRALEACNPIYREEFLTMCANPETLAAATESSRGRKQLAAAVTNPATPRTAKVEKLTQDLPLDLLLKYFTLQLVSDLSAHFAPETHEDLIARVAAHPEELTQNFRDSYAPEFMATTELPDLDALFSDYPDVAGRLKNAGRRRAAAPSTRPSTTSMDATRPTSPPKSGPSYTSGASRTSTGASESPSMRRSTDTR